MNKLIKIILGLIVIIGSFALILEGMPLESWGIAALDLIKGGLTLSVLTIGLILVIVGLVDFKEN